MLSAAEFISSTPNTGAKKSKSNSHPRGTGNRCRRSSKWVHPTSQITLSVEWISLYLRESDHAECKEFISSTLNTGVEKIKNNAKVEIESNCL